MEHYLDNSATTAVSPSAAEKAFKVMTEIYGNPSSLHTKGIEAEKELEQARLSLAERLGAQHEEIFFTSGGTEANNLAVFGAAEAKKRSGKRIVVSSAEHSSVLEAAKHLEQNGWDVVYITPCADGTISTEDVAEQVDKNTTLVSVMYVNNETGYVLPVKEVFTAVKRRFKDIVTHTDCVQAYMKLPVKANQLGADLISLSGHKIHGVKGVGALYIKKGIRLIPVVTGGKQEKGIRSGTESVPLICAFGAAVGKLSPTIKERYERVSELKARLAELLSAIEGVEINSPEDGSPYVVNISAAGKRSEIMLHYLEGREIYVSSGSACSKGQQSGVPAQFGITGKRADSALRISMTADTTEAEIEAFAAALAEGIASVRG